MRSPRSRIGQKGEIIAAGELGRLGYRIIDSNYRTQYGEIDLVALDGEYLVFVEVRSLSSDAFCKPVETINSRKIARIIYAAQHYIEAKQMGERAVRFDVVEVVYTKDASPSINIIKDAFIP